MSVRARHMRRSRGVLSHLLRLVLSLSFVVGVITLETEEASGCHDHEPLHPSVSCDACWFSANHTGISAPTSVTLSAPELQVWAPIDHGETALPQGAERSLHRLRAPPTH
ncbi:MAG: hypothetical protein KDA27_01440 [Candidatus Eisenbacteria bacterium]|uniref:Uncharacterized protein n=1 Tax=Eiseniibacteriota bacterium TaxID=2212470 RepID=A0A956N947_UNCEI|nr:hypothetical protein [Candidatus Eisenbacteria bacterium]MCB9466208.1 hypothetical protein [Candidatus Eisenbacteria bacterium]